MNPEALRGWPAPAKLNLFLHVLGRREDGYHRLQTVFIFLDYGDVLDFTLLPEGTIARQVMPGQQSLADVAEEDDLVVRAARLLQQRSGTRQGALIALHKQIPLGAGLGGGSSDAATTLLALNYLWKLGWSRSQLAVLGLSLGADVPVFLAGQAAFAEGVGEQLTPLTVPTAWYLVAHPGLSIATREIFAAPDLTRNTLPVKMSDFSVGFGHNDLQPVAVRLYPRVGQLLERLSHWGPARMTGSGACCFVSFACRAEALQALQDITPEYNGFVAQGLDRHPLYDRV